MMLLNGYVILDAVVSMKHVVKCSLHLFKIHTTLCYTIQFPFSNIFKFALLRKQIGKFKIFKLIETNKKREF